MYLCSETLEPLEVVQRLEAGAGEGLPGYPDWGSVLQQQALTQRQAPADTTNSD